MGRLTKARHWINRDNGRHFRIGNVDVGVLEVVTVIGVIVVLVLTQL